MRRLLLILCLLCAWWTPPEIVCAQQGQRWLDHSAPINRNSPLNRGLVSWWLVLPEGPRGGLYWRDLCGRNHGTLTNMDPATDWVRAGGRRGGFGALDFDSTNDQVACGSNILLTGECTLAAWVYRRSNASYDVVIMNGAYPNAKASIAFRNNTTSMFFWHGFNELCSTTYPGNNIWFHVCFTRTGSTGAWDIASYINGAAAATASTSVNPSSSNVTTIGSFGATSDIMDGMIDDVRAYKRALSAAEVRALYQDACQGYPQTLAWRGGSYRAPDAGPPPSSNGNFLPLLSTLAPEHTWEGVDHDPRHSPFAILGALAP